jgi:PAS domain S-box-containing protein
VAIRRLLPVLSVAGILTASLLVWRETVRAVFATDFLPHAYCFLGRPGLIWTHVISDSAIALAYLSISITLAYLVYRGRREVPFHWMFLSFGLFIVACGSTHLVEAITVWNPIYVFLGALKVFTAAASLTTAAILPFTVPRIQRLIHKAKATEQVAARLHASERRKQALLQEAQESKEMFERFFESAPDAILVTDQQGRITDLNRQALSMFGYRREELVGQSIEQLVPEGQREGHKSQREEYLQAPKMRPMGEGLELSARCKDGTLVPVDITLSPLHSGSNFRVMAAVRDITDHKEAEKKIMASLREKEVLLREIHHRVKNNLAVICSLMYLESTYAKDERTAQVFRESESRVHSMALVHENLYGSKDLGCIDFSQYAKVLATDILSSYGNQENGNAKVQLKSEMEPVIMTIDMAVPCGLILNELLSNAMKHGFPGSERGEIKITLRSGPEKACLLRVDDTGRGIPSDMDLTSNRSLGLRLVRSLTRQIRGSFELVRTEPGTSARVQFPASPAH